MKIFIALATVLTFSYNCLALPQLYTYEFHGMEDPNINLYTEPHNPI